MYHNDNYEAVVFHICFKNESNKTKNKITA